MRPQTISMSQKVCAFVYNNCKNDARVLKEAKTLTDNGYSVKIIAFLDDKTVAEETRDGFHISRVTRNPLHQRFLAAFKNLNPLSLLFKLIRWFIGLLRPKASAAVTGSSSKRGWFFTKVVKPALIIQRFGIKSYLERQGHSILIFALPGVLAFLVYKTFRIIVFILRRILRYMKKLRALIYRLLRQLLMNFHKPLSYWDYYVRSAAVVGKEQFDVFHAHDLNVLPLAWWMARKQKAKLVYDSHELYVEKNRVIKATAFKKWRQRKAEQFLVRRCDAVITVGEKIAEYMGELYKIPTPYVVLNAPLLSNVVKGNDDISIRKVLHIPDSQKIILYSGAITFNRGLAQLVESLQYMPNIYLVMMGFGNEAFKNNLKAIALKVNAEHRFSFFGPVPPSDVASYVSSVDLGVAPIQNACLSYYFCSPNKIFEYMLGGVPVVASNFPELSNLVEKWKIGYTFDPENPKDIARSIDQMFADPAEFAAMKHRTKEAAAHHNWEIESQKLVSIYETITRKTA